MVLWMDVIVVGAMRSALPRASAMHRLLLLGNVPGPAL